MTGELCDLLSEKGQECVRQIDQIYIKEGGPSSRELFSFDMKPIDPIIDDDDEEEDEKNGLGLEKPARPLGIFI